MDSEPKFTIGPLGSILKSIGIDPKYAYQTAHFPLFRFFKIKSPHAFDYIDDHFHALSNQAKNQGLLPSSCAADFRAAFTVDVSKLSTWEEAIIINEVSRLKSLNSECISYTYTSTAETHMHFMTHSIFTFKKCELLLAAFGYRMDNYAHCMVKFSGSMGIFYHFFSYKA